MCQESLRCGLATSSKDVFDGEIVLNGLSGEGSSFANVRDLRCDFVSPCLYHTLLEAYQKIKTPKSERNGNSNDDVNRIGLTETYLV